MEMLRWILFSDDYFGYGEDSLQWILFDRNSSVGDSSAAILQTHQRGLFDEVRLFRLFNEALTKPVLCTSDTKDAARRRRFCGEQSRTIG